MRGFVFGYGSLAADAYEVGRAGVTVARLEGYRRVWNVAMDNSVSLPDYKYYVDPQSGERADLFVTFLDLEPATGHRCVGMLLPVGEAELQQLDRRERNYTRIEVTGQIEAGNVVVDRMKRVWTYIGTDAARQRFARGMRLGTAVIQREYHAAVEAGFERFGLLGEFRASTVPPACPQVSLRRVEISQAD